MPSSHPRALQGLPLCSDWDSGESCCGSRGRGRTRGRTWGRISGQLRGGLRCCPALSRRRTCGWTTTAVPDREPSPPVTSEDVSPGLFVSTLWGGPGARLRLCLPHVTDPQSLSPDSDARERQEYTQGSHTRHLHRSGCTRSCQGQHSPGT